MDVERIDKILDGVATGVINPDEGREALLFAEAKEDWPDADTDRIMLAATTIKRIDHGCGVGTQTGRAEVTLEVEADTDAFIGWMVSLIKWLNAENETRIYTVTGRRAHGD